jgi:hypothetical protein
MYNGCFKNLDTPEKTYWFGFLIGDGNISIKKNNWGYVLTINLIDKEHLEKLSLFLGYSIDRVKIIKTYFNLQIGCKELIYDLMNLGLTPKKSLTVTDSVIPKNYQWDFLRGLIDADGCIHIRKLNYTTTLSPCLYLFGNHPLLEGVKNIINEKGYFKYRKRESGSCSELYYGGRQQVTRILDKIYYCKPYLDRKFAIYKTIKDSELEKDIYGHRPHRSLYQWKMKKGG